MSRPRLAASLAQQNANLRRSITLEFASLKKKAGQPTYHAAMHDYRTKLLDAVDANDRVLHDVFGPAATGILSDMRLFWEQDADVYGGVGSLWRHLAKDWTSEGAAAQSTLRRRVASIVKEECRRRPAGETARILVPGCGQGRLAVEIARACSSSDVFGVERSPAQLGFAHYFLQIDAPPLTFHPWLDAFPNNLTTASRASALTAAADAPMPPANLTVTSGDLLALAPADLQGGHDVCVTAFLLDCLDDLGDGVAAIRSALKPGGLWVFAGPLHYHQGGGYQPKPAPTLEQLICLVDDLGFDLEPQSQVGDPTRQSGKGTPPGVEMIAAPYVARPGAFLDEADWRVPLFAARRRA